MSSQLLEKMVVRAVHTDPAAVLADAYARFAADRIAISFSGAEDVVLIDLASRVTDDIAVFSLDTGRLHPQTYQFIEAVRERYAVEIEMLSPDPIELGAFVRRKGLFSFYRDGHHECCAVRKIGPLKRHLAGLDAWITGQRRDQGVTRTDVPTAQEDLAFSTPEHRIIKFNPLAGWTSADVWAYIRSNDVPYNPLHDRGFSSIGCEPCTRAVAPHESERSGRWWWEQPDAKECGLHSQNLKPIRIVG